MADNLRLGSLSNDVFLVDINHDGKLDLVEDGGMALGDPSKFEYQLTSYTCGSSLAAGGHARLVSMPNGVTMESLIARVPFQATD